MRQYGRNDVSYETWYSPWMKQLAQNYTVRELEKMLGKTEREATGAARAHLRAIEATTSMTSQSARRAHARNVTAACGEHLIAVNGAIEIHELFPEHAKHPLQPNNQVNRTEPEG